MYKKKQVYLDVLRICTSALTSVPIMDCSRAQKIPSCTFPRQILSASQGGCMAALTILKWSLDQALKLKNKNKEITHKTNKPHQFPSTEDQ